MKKILFENGKTIDGASTFNKMQDNVEDVFNGKESMGSIVVEDITCKNKFNKNTITSGKGISTATGDLYSQSSLFTTDYIDVTDSSDIAWNGTYTSGTKPWGAFYDSNKKYISGFETTLNVNTIAIPTGVAYVRLTYADNSNDFLNKLQIESGSVVTNYVEYKEFTLSSDASSVGNAIFTKYGHLVIVSGWFILNGSEATFTAPYKPTSQCWFPTNGVLASVDASGVSGFGIIYPENGNIMIKMSGAITYCTTGFCYYTND